MNLCYIFQPRHCQAPVGGHDQTPADVQELQGQAGQEREGAEGGPLPELGRQRHKGQVRATVAQSQLFSVI